MATTRGYGSFRTAWRTLHRIKVVSMIQKERARRILLDFKKSNLIAKMPRKPRFSAFLGDLGILAVRLLFLKAIAIAIT